MTIEIAEFRCPSCGHTMGEEEYKHACNKFNNTVQAACINQIDKVRDEYEEKIYEQEQKHIELENRIDHEAELRANKRLSEQEEVSKNKIEAITEECEQKLRKKHEEIEV